MVVRMIALMLVSAAAQRVVLEPDASALGETARWKDTGRCQAHDIVNLMVMMQHSPQQLSTLEKTLLAVSDPRSSAYGQHMTQSEVTDLMAPPEENLNAVLDWINEVGPQNVSVGVHQDIISVDLSAQKAELLLQTEFHQYQHITTKISITRAIRHYSVPESVAPFIKIVGNVLSFPAITGPQVVSDSEASAVSPNKPPLGQFPDDCGLFCIDKVSRISPSVFALMLAQLLANKQNYHVLALRAGQPRCAVSALRFASSSHRSQRQQLFTGRRRVPGEEKSA